jgi:hypothetical protein
MTSFITKYKLTSIAAVIIIGLMISFMRFNYPQTSYFTYDNFGYYLYLPALVIYDDIKIEDFTWVEEINQQYTTTPTYYQFDNGNKNNKVIRFFMGMSVLYSPGFAAGHIWALNSDYPADGFSLPYQLSVKIWGILFLVIGAFYLRKVLLHFFSDAVTTATMLFLFVGTNLFFFSALGNDSPHVYLFAVTSIVVWYNLKWHQNHKLKDAIALGFFIGLLVISRPSEVTIFFLILLWGVSNKKDFLDKMRTYWSYRKQLIWFAAAGLLFLILQMTYWQMATGKWLFFPYTDPGSAMDLTNPRFGWVLFSFRKGWLIYSPLMIFSLVGFFHLYRERRDIFWPVLIVFLLNLYMIASFSSLVSYGYRAFIQGYALLAIPLGFFIKYIFSRKALTIIVSTVIILLFFGLNIFQAWQTHMGVIDGSRMTREYYFRVFLKDKVTEEDRKLLLIERSATGIDNFTNEDEYNRKVLYFDDFENPDEKLADFYDTTVVFDGKYSFRMDSSRLYSHVIDHKYHEVTNDYYAWIRTTVKFFPANEESVDNVFLATSFHHKGHGHKWRALRSDRLGYPVKAGEWNTMTFDYLTPEVRSDEEVLRIFMWNPNNVLFYIDDLQIEVFERKR